MITRTTTCAKREGALLRRPLRTVAMIVASIMMFQGTIFAASAPVSADASMELRVMTFNIFYGGDEMSLDTLKFCLNPTGSEETLDQVVQTIIESDADVVGIQEGMMNTARIAEWLADYTDETWYCNERMQIVSRYPLVDPSGANGDYVFIEPVAGRVAAMTNVHLPAEPYTPYEIRDGATLEEVLEMEMTWRVEESSVSESPSITHLCEVLPPLLANDIPLIFTGDFNSPSHLDWTEEVAEVRDVVRYPVEWPATKALEDMGFRDSYREIHPDPVETPGFTWTPGSLDGVEDEVHDRVDFVLAAGPLTTVDSQLMGEPENVDVDIVVDPWPSDHRGVVSTFEVTLGTAAPFVAVEDRRLEVGDDLRVDFHASGAEDERVAIVSAGGIVDDAVFTEGTEGVTDGLMVFATDDMDPDAYEAVLVGADGEEAARIPFWLYETGATTTVTTSKREYAVGEPVVVTWANAPGLFADWVGLYRGVYNTESPTQTDSYAGWGAGNSVYLLWEYTHATVEGTIELAGSSPGAEAKWPLQPGCYEVRYLLDDQYRCIAQSYRFWVV